MKRNIVALVMGLTLAITPLIGAGETPKDNKPKSLLPPLPRPEITAEHLQNVSVTIRAEAEYSAGEGSGVIFTRKDSKGNLVNFVWTAGHVVDNLRTERRVLVNGSPKTLVEFKDPVVIKEIR